MLWVKHKCVVIEHCLHLTFFSFLPVQQSYVNVSSHLLDLKNKDEWSNAQKVSITIT